MMVCNKKTGLLKSIYFWMDLYTEQCLLPEENHSFAAGRESATDYDTVGKGDHSLTL